MVSILLVIVLIFTLLIVLNSKQQEITNQNIEKEFENHEPLEYEFDLSGQPFIGDEDAPVTMVEMFDFKCPGCLLWDKEVLPYIKETYIDTGKAKLYLVNYPIVPIHGSEAYDSALALESVYAHYPDQVLDFYSVVYDSQDERLTLTPESLRDLISEQFPDMDAELIYEDIKTKKYKDEVEKDLKMVTESGTNSTPTLFINNQRVEAITEDGTGNKVIKSNGFAIEQIDKLINEGLEGEK